MEVFCIGNGLDGRITNNRAMMADADIFQPNFVRQLFDEMSQTYSVVNYIASFGFTARWQKQCVRRIKVPLGATVYDLMTGMGEMCSDISRMIGSSGRIRAIDISPRMCARARQRLRHRITCSVEVIEADILDNGIDSGSADVIVSSFGLKTFSEEQTVRLAREIHRILKPGGQFSLLEISVPPSAFLRIPYMFYLKYVVPVIGMLFMGNPANYRLLGIYTEAFNDCSFILRALEDTGLQVRSETYFFGCATGVSGYKKQDLGAI